MRQTSSLTRAPTCRAVDDARRPYLRACGRRAACAAGRGRVLAAAGALGPAHAPARQRPRRRGLGHVAGLFRGDLPRR
eukprot:5897512-Prymnesium_polylepis.1